MKGKLSKSDIQYRLHNEEGIIIATSHDGKLSKKNCDEIFGVVDVDKLATQHLIDKNCVSLHTSWQGYNENTYKDGFNKAMELNKDKVFTSEDMKGYFDWHKKQGYISHKPEDIDEYIQSIQQPTEIDVEIVMEEKYGYNLWTNPVEKKFSHLGPKLDSSQRLILKRI